MNEKSIRDLTPNDVRRARQFHAFAGIGVWSYALRLAGWPDDDPVWTGSCPCQPFSVAGKGRGVADERHLWPAWFDLIRECRPPVIFGEQVASPDGLAWLDAVHADLEGAGYAVGAVDLCAAGVGAPHQRQRLYFVGRQVAHGRNHRGDAVEGAGPGGGGSARAVAESDAGRRGPTGIAGVGRPLGERGEDTVSAAAPANAGTHGTLAVSDQERRHGEHALLRADRGRQGEGAVFETTGRSEAGPVNGFWGDAEWIACLDGKFRATEPGTFPLAHGATARVGRLRGYGNAIVAHAAAEVVRAYMDTTGGAPAIGIEVEERWCEVAANRLRQEVLL